MALCFALTFAFGLSGCGDDDGSPAGVDSGTRDSGFGVTDAGGGTADAGGVMTDGGGAMSDAGGGPTDAGGTTGDAGSPRGCGARLGDTCGPTEFCDFPAGALCGAADGTGICAARPTACTDEVNPVCGCDGMDYSNPCNAHAAGTDDATVGMCGATADCRTTGCSTGNTCMLCFAAYACIPDGAVC